MRVRLLAGSGDALCVSGSRIAPTDAPVDATLRLGEGSLRPGLINAHDHLHRNHYPRLGAPPYRSAYAWGEDLHARCREDLARARSLGRGTALLFGVLKNLLGGATAVVHHDAWEPAFLLDFPLRVPRLRTAHSLRLEPDLSAAVKGEGPSSGAPLTLHLAEGTDAASADEVREAACLGLLDAHLLAVHLVGADAEGVATLRRSGAAAVWCPTSNAFLFGRTAPAALLAPGLDVLLGTDALVTGEGTLLDELRAARALGFLDDGRLEDAVGATAARRLSLPAPSLSPGAPADVVFLRKPLFEARARDVALVLVGGMPRLADAEFRGLFNLAGVACEPLTVGGLPKLVAAPLARAAAEAAGLFPECGRILE